VTARNVTALTRLAGEAEMSGDHLNSRFFLEAHGEHVRRSPELGRWYVWNGAWWEEDRLDRVPQMATGVIDTLRSWVALASSPDEFKRRVAHYQASAKAGRRDALLSIAGTDPDVVVAVDELDAHPMLLAARNGTVDLSTGTLRPADPTDLLTRGVDVDFDPEATSERWRAFLEQIFSGNSDLIAYVQRLLGYCLTGDVNEHVVPVLTGPGANGKSTLIGLIQDLLGEHATTAPEGLIIRREHEPHPERLAMLRGRRLVVSAELEHRAVLAEAVVKVLSGGDTVSARELYGRRFNFKPTHKIVLVTNHRPRVHGTDHAIWRRLRVVPFEVVIPPESQDRALRRGLLQEDGPAVLAWLVQGAVQWHGWGLGDVIAVRAATDEYRAAEDTMATFLAECTVPIGTARTKVGVLYDAWRSWCEKAGEQPGRKQDFTSGLAEHGLEFEKYQGTTLTRGIGLVVRSREDSSGNSAIPTSTETLRGRPHETSPEQMRADLA
jgi:putative DNA primase/helicase